MHRFAASIAIVLSASLSQAQAQDDPTGTWKWNVALGTNTIQFTAKLKLDGDKLTGVHSWRDNTETPIQDATFKDNKVEFTAVRETNNRKVTIKYSGTLSGDAIKGKIQFDQ